MHRRSCLSCVCTLTLVEVGVWPGCGVSRQVLSWASSPCLTPGGSSSWSPAHGPGHSESPCVSRSLGITWGGS